MTNCAAKRATAHIRGSRRPGGGESLYQELLRDNTAGHFHAIVAIDDSHENEPQPEIYVWQP